MSLTVKNTGGDFELPPEDQYTARCYRIIDLGTQESTFEGKKELKHKVLMQWELLSGAMMKDGRPFSIGRRFNASLHEKADLRKLLESWRGRAFTDEELEGFELSKVLGAYALLQVVHEGDYANVQALMKMPQGMPKPAPVNENLLIDFDDFNWSAYESLSDKLRETIAASPEFKALAAARGKPASKLVGTGTQGALPDDDVEF